MCSENRRTRRPAGTDMPWRSCRNIWNRWLKKHVVCEDCMLFREEELVKSVAPLPVLSADLRTRVLAAALEVRARRTQGRRVLAGSAVLFLLLGWIAWTGPLLPSASQLAATESAPGKDLAGDGASVAAAPVASAPYSRRELFIAAMGDDWRMVEAEFKTREDFTRRVQM